MIKIILTYLTSFRTENSAPVAMNMAPLVGQINALLPVLGIPIVSVEDLAPATFISLEVYQNSLTKAGIIDHSILALGHKGSFFKSLPSILLFHYNLRSLIIIFLLLILAPWIHYTHKRWQLRPIMALGMICKVKPFPPFNKRRI